MSYSISHVHSLSNLQMSQSMYCSDRVHRNHVGPFSEQVLRQLQELLLMLPVSVDTVVLVNYFIY